MENKYTCSIINVVRTAVSTKTVFRITPNPAEKCMSAAYFQNVCILPKAAEKQCINILTLSFSRFSSPIYLSCNIKSVCQTVCQKIILYNFWQNIRYKELLMNSNQTTMNTVTTGACLIHVTQLCFC